MRAVGQSGRRYLVERVLQEKPGPLGRVYLASADGQKYVLKGMPKTEFKYFQDMYTDLQRCPYVRVADDTIVDQSMFAYKYFRDHLLSFAQRDVPLPLTKRILRNSLRGIAALHEKGIVHTDIKPNNIMVDWDETQNGNLNVEHVQIADLEDAAYVPDDCAIVGRQAGNWMWRSPEAHASGQVQKPSDIFSFGVVCIYAVTKTVIFAVDEEELKEGEDKLAVVLERQLSYFADGIDDLEGLLQYLGDDSPWVRIFTIIAEGFGEDFPRRPFSLWRGVDPDFKDLVGKMTNIDPRRRITAHEALGHRCDYGRPIVVNVDDTKLRHVRELALLPYAEEDTETGYNAIADLLPRMTGLRRLLVEIPLHYPTAGSDELLRHLGRLDHGSFFGQPCELGNLDLILFAPRLTKLTLVNAVVNGSCLEACFVTKQGISFLLAIPKALQSFSFSPKDSSLYGSDAAPMDVLGLAGHILACLACYQHHSLTNLSLEIIGLAHIDDYEHEAPPAAHISFLGLSSLKNLKLLAPEVNAFDRHFLSFLHPRLPPSLTNLLSPTLHATT
ncbi:hypothetical protein DV735_g2739, partial [Chaetothyriales sp. CBS 134920]